MLYIMYYARMEMHHERCVPFFLRLALEPSIGDVEQIQGGGGDEDVTAV